MKSLNRMDSLNLQNTEQVEYKYISSTDRITDIHSCIDIIQLGNQLVSIEEAAISTGY